MCFSHGFIREFSHKSFILSPFNPISYCSRPLFIPVVEPSASHVVLHVVFSLNDAFISHANFASSIYLYFFPVVARDCVIGRRHSDFKGISFYTRPPSSILRSEFNFQKRIIPNRNRIAVSSNYCFECHISNWFLVFFGSACF